MRKILRTVTLTGADDSTDPQGLVKLSKKYPFVEWGILLSKSNEGKSRFPSYDWRDNLARLHIKEIFAKTVFVLSGHVCGKWVRDIGKGDWTYRQEQSEFWGMFDRIQLNFGSAISKIDNQKFLKGLDGIKKSIILQVPDVKNSLLAEAQKKEININGLFDKSGGNGVLPKDWPKTDKDQYIGYAGGLSPENLEGQLLAIEKRVAKDQEIWIDAETNLRSSADKFDLDKCEKFLKIAQPWVVKTEEAPQPKKARGRPRNF